MLKKSREELMAGMVVSVNASMSLGRPGIAPDIISEGPRAERMDDRRRG